MLDSKYEGATVIDTHRGYYGAPDQQVILVDFASLYPNVMITHRICPTRYVRSNIPEEVAASLEPGVTVKEHRIGATKTVRLATPSGDDSPPIFTDIIKKLLRERALVRKAMKTITDKGQLEVLDCRQKAKKVMANSAYGILGTSTGMMPLPDLAAVITYEGRMALLETKRIAEEKYGAFVVGGGTFTHMRHVLYLYSTHVLHFSPYCFSYSDTDSIFFTLPHPTAVPAAPDEAWMRERMIYVFEMAATIARDITDRFKELHEYSTLDLEFEGVMFPSLFLKKKNYAAVLWNPVKPGATPVAEEKLMTKGLVSKRRVPLHSRRLREFPPESCRIPDFPSAAPPY